MHNFLFAILLIFSAGLIACVKSTPTADDASQSARLEGLTEEQKKEVILYDELMQIHDDVMPLTPQLNRCQRKLKALLPQISDEEQVALINEKIRQLNSANEGMMTWMQQYNKDSPENYRKVGLDHSQIMGNLQKIRAEIVIVDKEMRQALKTGEELLEKSGR